MSRRMLLHAFPFVYHGFVLKRRYILQNRMFYYHLDHKNCFGANPTSGQNHTKDYGRCWFSYQIYRVGEFGVCGFLRKNAKSEGIHRSTRSVSDHPVIRCIRSKQSLKHRSWMVMVFFLLGSSNWTYSAWHDSRPTQCVVHDRLWSLVGMVYFTALC